MKVVAVFVSCLSLMTQAGELRIAAASDLKFALDEIIAAFTNHNSSSSIKATFGAS